MLTWNAKHWAHKGAGFERLPITDLVEDAVDEFLWDERHAPQI
jgi:hypothetical protein